MTLRKQLCIVITVLFSLIFLGTFLLSVKNLQIFLQGQLISRAENAANSIAVSLSQYPADDKATFAAVIDSIFKSGQYHRIAITGLNEELILERNLNQRTPNAPQWLTSMVSLKVPPAEALLSVNWRQVGTVTVESDIQKSYDTMWADIKELFWMFFIAALLTTLLGLIALRYLLKPLHDIKLQAAAICAQDFSIKSKIPKTKELATIVRAMNAVSDKVQQLFSEQTRLTEKLREQAYKDLITNLANRRYFMMQLENLLGSPEEFTTGALFLISINSLDNYKKHHGFEASDLLLTRVANILRNLCTTSSHFLAARLSDHDFALLAPNITADRTKKTAIKIHDYLVDLHSDIEQQSLSFNIGVSLYRSRQNSSEFLAAADMALCAARSKGDNAWHLYDTADLGESLLQGASAWLDQLEQAIQNQAVVLHFQTVRALGKENGSVLHYEVLMRIPDKNNNLLNAGLFIPMAENFDKMIDLDKLVINKLIALFQQGKTAKDKFSINLSPSSVGNENFVNWLYETLAENPDFARQLIFELPEQVAIHELDNLTAMVKRIKKLGSEFCLDHFGRGFASFKYLKDLPVDYLKIDGSYIRHIELDTGNQFFVHVVTEIAHNLSIKVIAENVEYATERETLENLNVDGIQGYYIGEPSPRA